MTTYTTLRPGKYSNPLTWIGGQVPLPESMVTIAHNVTLDCSVTTCGLMINTSCTLLVDPTKSITLSVCGRIEGHGKLVSRPPASVQHLIQLHDIIESDYTGNNDTDSGIYIMSNWELKGAPKTAWCNLAAGAKKGDTTIRLNMSPAGWKTDELWIAPTVRGVLSGEYVAIKSIKGSLATLASPLQYDHPVVISPNTSRIFTAEVINLTRNLRIEGFPGARGHIMFMAGVQTISNVQVRYMGVPGVKGRYPLHFHKCGDVSRGTMITGCVIRDSGNHAVVTHASHGVSYKDCATVGTRGHAWWYDDPEKPLDTSNSTNDLLYDHCISALTYPAETQYGVTDFMLGAGTGNEIRNCVATCNQAGPGSSMLQWPSSVNQIPNLWINTGCLAHNMAANAFKAWQNDWNNHNPIGHAAYNIGGYGIHSGAYSQCYKWDGIDLIDCDILVDALPRPGGIVDQWGYIQHFKDCFVRTVIITFHTLPGGGPVLFLRCKFGSVLVADLRAGVSGLYDFVDCETVFDIVAMEPGSVVRVQDGSTAREVTVAGVKGIEKFFNY